jgi:dimethylargininase
MPVAIVRQLSATFSNCELSFVPRAPIDLELAHVQHRAYQQALVDAGCEVIELPAQDALPDAVFVEDTALVLDEVAVMTRPGAATRQAEGATVRQALAQFRPLLAIEAPGTLDGGDVMRIGRTLYVGDSARSNAAGHAQLRALLAPHGYAVEALPTRECLHLKSAVTEVAPGTLLINPAWIDREHFAAFDLIEVDPTEEHAANTLRIGDSVIYPSCFPRTQERLERAGIRVRAVDLSELQKAEGAVTCCSLVFADARPH